MTSSKDHQDHSELDNNHKSSGRLGSAARRYLLSLLSMMLEAQTKAFFEKVLLGKKDIQALHVNCGRGDDTYMMASLLDESSQIVGGQEVY